MTTCFLVISKTFRSMTEKNAACASTLSYVLATHGTVY